MAQDTRQDDWRSGWPDAVAFAGGLFVAWWSRWRTTDLVWSLWLSSLVVGYAMILWAAARPVLAIAGAARARRAGEAGSVQETSGGNLALAVALTVVGGLFLLAFFTLHFVGFHYVHSQFLAMLFPIDGAGSGRLAVYREVARRYWIFLPSAFLAERSAFTPAEPAPTGPPSVTADAIAERQRANLAGRRDVMLRPYRQVIRMHFLIFFFVLAHFAHLESFAVYVVVYAVYFFPWRLVRRADEALPAAVAS